MNLLRRIRDAVLMGLAWTAVWAPIGALIEMMDPAASTDRIWVPVAQSAPLCGAIFSVVMGIAEGRRRLAEVPLPRAAAWGLAIGLFVGALPFAISTPTTDLPIWLLGAEIIGPVILLSAVSGVGSVLVARMVAKRALRGG